MLQESLDTGDTSRPGRYLHNLGKREGQGMKVPDTDQEGRNKHILGSTGRAGSRQKATS
jgi:hypothetical protein